MGTKTEEIVAVCRSRLVRVLLLRIVVKTLTVAGFVLGIAVLVSRAAFGYEHVLVPFAAVSVPPLLACGLVRAYRRSRNE